jgi:hypothetical protein
MKINCKTFVIFSLFLIFLNKSVMAQNLEGRWDLTLYLEDKTVPAWLEVNHSGLKTFTGHFVGDGGSSRPISKIDFKNKKLFFSIPPQWENYEKDLEVEGELKNDILVGTMTLPDGKNINWTGKRAPRLIRSKQPIWGNPIRLFNGKNLDGWETFGADNQWIVENGVLKSPKSGANIKTKNLFNDFKLHVEFKVPTDGNSGVYLRGRYEVQISDGYGKEPSKGELGAIYGFIMPLEIPAKKADQWQSFDITLVGRVVTVILNGKTIIYKNEIPGITGGAIDSNEADPGPIMFQGDHGPIEFKNIILTPAK